MLCSRNCPFVQTIDGLKICLISRRPLTSLHTSKFIVVLSLQQRNNVGVMQSVKAGIRHGDVLPRPPSDTKLRGLSRRFHAAPLSILRTTSHDLFTCSKHEICGHPLASSTRVIPYRQLRGVDLREACCMSV